MPTCGEYSITLLNCALDVVGYSSLDIQPLSWFCSHGSYVAVPAEFLVYGQSQDINDGDRNDIEWKE